MRGSESKAIVDFDMADAKGEFAIKYDIYEQKSLNIDAGDAKDELHLKSEMESYREAIKLAAKKGDAAGVLRVLDLLSHSQSKISNPCVAGGLLIDVLLSFYNENDDIGSNTLLSCKDVEIYIYGFLFVFTQKQESPLSNRVTYATAVRNLCRYGLNIESIFKGAKLIETLQDYPQTTAARQLKAQILWDQLESNKWFYQSSMPPQTLTPEEVEYFSNEDHQSKLAFLGRALLYGYISPKDEASQISFLSCFASNMIDMVVEFFAQDALREISIVNSEGKVESAIPLIIQQHVVDIARRMAIMIEAGAGHEEAYNEGLKQLEEVVREVKVSENADMLDFTNVRFFSMHVSDAQSEAILGGGLSLKCAHD